MMHTANKMRLLTKDTALILSRKDNFLWHLGMDSWHASICTSAVFCIQNIPTSDRFRSFSPYALGREPPQDHEFLSWGATCEKQRPKHPLSIVRPNFVWVWTWVSHMWYEMLWPAAASPVQLLSIFHWVGEFWQHLPDWIIKVNWGAVRLMSN